jgi:hypothetical protein
LINDQLHVTTVAIALEMAPSKNICPEVNPDLGLPMPFNVLVFKRSNIPKVIAGLEQSISDAWNPVLHNSYLSTVEIHLHL